MVYEDISIPAPPVDLTTDVNRMHALGVDLVASCMDLSGNILLSRTMHQDGMGSVAQYWLNGYDEAAIAKFSNLMQGRVLPHRARPVRVGEARAGQVPRAWRCT